MNKFLGIILILYVISPVDFMSGIPIDDIIALLIAIPMLTGSSEDEYDF